MSEARARQVPPRAITFNYAAYRSAGWPRLANVERLRGHSGWLKVSILSVTPADPSIGQRDRLIVAGFCDDAPEDPAQYLDQASVDDLFLVPGADGGAPVAPPAARLAPLEDASSAAVAADIEAESRRWLDEETEKLDTYADDLEQAADIRIKEIEAEIRAAKKALRSNTAVSLNDKVKEQRRIKAMQTEADDLKLTTFQKRRAVRTEMDEKLDAIAQALKTTPTIAPLITIRWTVPL